MFKPHYGKCIECGNDRLIVVKRGVCGSCNELGKIKNNSPKKQSDTKTKHVFARKGRVVSSLKRGAKRTTGELELFKKIYEERGPYSQVAPYDYVEFDLRIFSHVLSKCAYPSLRLEPENIVIKTPAQHAMWHNQYHKLKGLPEWQWVLEKEQALKRKYYQENRIKKL